MSYNWWVRSVQMDAILSWVMAISGFIGSWFVGRKMYVGWIILAITQVMWATYGVLVHRWSFVLSGVVYIFICGKSALSWSHSTTGVDDGVGEHMIIDDAVAELHTS